MTVDHVAHARRELDIDLGDLDRRALVAAYADGFDVGLTSDDPAAGPSVWDLPEGREPLEEEARWTRQSRAEARWWSHGWRAGRAVRTRRPVP